MKYLATLTFGRAILVKYYGAEELEWSSRITLGGQSSALKGSSKICYRLDTVSSSKITGNVEDDAENEAPLSP